MTITKEQLDELEREGLEELRFGQFATCVLVQPETTLELVTVYRAALAWNEARRAVTAAYEDYEDSGVLAPLTRARAAFDRAETALVAALGAP